MTVRRLIPALLGIVAWLSPVVAPAQQADVTFFGAGKVARFQQDQHGTPAAINFVYFAEVFLTREGHASEAHLTFPGGTKALEYQHSDSPLINDVMYISGAAATRDELDRIFPDGDYQFAFRTPSGDIANGLVTFKGADFPRAPVITLAQDGAAISIDKIDAAKDLVVTWSPFPEGAADDNGILDDLIFVDFDSCAVEDMVHSGRPFEGTGYLTYAATEYRIKAGTFEPGQSYSMSVEHAVLADTRMVSGVPAFATFASSTHMNVATLGQAEGDICPKDR